MLLSELLSRFSDVEDHADGGYIARCPAHNDSNPSLRIWRGADNKVRITCRASCQTWDVLSRTGLNWSDLFDVVGAGQTVPAEPPAPADGMHLSALTRYVQEARMGLSSGSEPAIEAAQYLARRFGVDSHVSSAQGLGFDSGLDVKFFPYRSVAYKRHPRIVVPFYNFKAEIHGLQARDITGQCPARWVSLRNPDGHRWAQYGVFRGHGGYGATLVTEGPGDALSACAVGYDAVAVRGASLAANNDLVADLATGLRGSQVVVCGDSDSAGQGFAQRLAKGLAAHDLTVYTLELPAAVSDLSEWQETRPETFAAELHAAVRAAKPTAVAQEMARRAELDQRTGVETVSATQGKDAARILAELVTRYGESDAMNAHALVAWTNGSVRYAPGLGFYVWNGRVWERSDVKVRQEVHRMGAALVLTGKLKEAEGFTMTQRIDHLLTELRSVPSVYATVDDFDAQHDLLNFANGTVDLRSGKLREHRKEDMLTYCLAVDYKPAAKAERWEQFLTEIFPNQPDMPSYMQRLTGYGITGHTSEQCFAVLWGKGANGKSIFAETLTSVFQAVTSTTPFATFEDKQSGGIPNDLAALRGSRLVMASEGEAGKPMSESVLKRLTGKDRVSARFLRQEFFTFAPTFLIMLATNHKPSFKSQDEGLWRRVKLIPFQRWFAPNERDYDLDRKLLAEAEGIAAWAVRGAVEWYANGLRDPDLILSETREYRETSDTFAGFYPGVLEPTGDASAMSGAEAYETYKEWCEEEGLQQREILARKTFYKAMAERGVDQRKGRLPGGYQGVILEGVRSTRPKVTGPGIFNG